MAIGWGETLFVACHNTDVCPKRLKELKKSYSKDFDRDKRFHPQVRGYGEKTLMISGLGLVKRWEATKVIFDVTVIS